MLGYAVFVVDFRVADGVQHQVHGRDAQHSAIGVKAGEGVPGKVLPLLGSHGVLIMLADVLRSGDEEARRTAGRVADGVVRSRL